MKRNLIMKKNLRINFFVGWGAAVRNSVGLFIHGILVLEHEPCPTSSAGCFMEHVDKKEAERLWRTSESKEKKGEEKSPALGLLVTCWLMRSFNPRVIPAVISLAISSKIDTFQSLSWPSTPFFPRKCLGVDWSPFEWFWNTWNWNIPFDFLNFLRNC